MFHIYIYVCVANIVAKIANALILQLMISLIIRQLSQAIITVILLYIGEPSGNFRYRFNNHTHSIRQKKLLPLPLPFNADDHNIVDSQSLHFERQFNFFKF